MNTAADRAEIATAASTVAGVACKPKYWQITKPGQGFVQYIAADRDTSGFGFMITWAVVLAMPQDFDAAEDWIDTKTPDLVEALADDLVITRIQPLDLVIASGKVPALQITGTRPDAG